MREESFLHPGDEYDRILEALGSVQRHQRGATAARIDLLAVADQRDPLEKFRQAAAGLLGVEGAGGAEYLGEILFAHRGVVERVEVRLEAAARDNFFDDSANAHLGEAAGKIVHPRIEHPG